jgi:hypothetical protein
MMIMINIIMKNMYLVVKVAVNAVGVAVGTQRLC